MCLNYYCKPILPKRKEFSEKFFGFFQKGRRGPEGGQEDLQPQLPQGQQKGAEQAEVQHRPSRCPQQEKQPQLPVPGQHEEGQGDAGGDAVGRIQQTAPYLAAQPPQHPQQVVDQPQAGAQQDGAEEHGQLLGDDVAHQPKSLRRNPPPWPPGERSS